MNQPICATSVPWEFKFLKIRKSITAPNFAKLTKDSPNIADNGSLVTVSLQGAWF